MAQPRVVLIVRFRSALPWEELLEILEERIDRFRALPGLQQKYYLRDEKTGEIAGLYLWESAEALDAYRQSELRATIAQAYQATTEPRVEVYQVEKVLRE